MALDELKNIARQLQEARQAEDVFGSADGHSADELKAAVKRAFLRLSQIADPDFYPGNEEARTIASEAMQRLRAFHEEALRKIETSTYGTIAANAVSSSGDLSITTDKRQYRIEGALAQGDLSVVYAGTASGAGLPDEKIVVKLVEDPADNDLMQNEIRVLRLLNTDSGVYGKHLPVILDEIRTQDGKIGIILKRIDAYDLHSVREKYPKGIPPRHIIWIFRRTLSVLGYAHSKGIIHGNIEPSHILISPVDHNIFLIDWAYSIYKPASTGGGFKVLNEKYSAPEVAEKKPPIPASDLYSVAKCMVYLLGGNVETNEMPAEVDDRIRRFILFFLRQSPIQRAQDAWEMYGKLDQLREEVFGPHQFIEFKM